MDEEVGKGEARLEPVDVDVVDNLVNAQAAYMEALIVALEHVEADPKAKKSEEMMRDLVDAFSSASGLVLTAIACERM
jgi:hypothetical protein